MIRDKVLDLYLNALKLEMSRVKDGLVENTTLTLEEFRRNQGIYTGLEIALEKLKDSLEATDK